jgi:hypothetical protein
LLGVVNLIHDAIGADPDTIKRDASQLLEPGRTRVPGLFEEGFINSTEKRVVEPFQLSLRRRLDRKPIAHKRPAFFSLCRTREYGIARSRRRSYHRAISTKSSAKAGLANNRRSTASSSDLGNASSAVTNTSAVASAAFMKMPPHLLDKYTHGHSGLIITEKPVGDTSDTFTGFLG